MEQITLQEQRKRKFLLWLPLLLVAVLALLFYFLGGGKGKPDEQANLQKGINTSLPGAQFAKNAQPQDKLSLYEKHRRDSIAAKEHEGGGFMTSLGFDTAGSLKQPPVSAAQANVKKISQQLAQINRVISQPEPRLVQVTNSPDQQSDLEAAKLQKLMKTMNNTPANDPQMKQLDGIMNKLLDIEHPERVAAQLKQQEKARPDSIYKAFRAVIADNQKVTAASSVKLRLVDTLAIKGQVIPKGALVYGYCEVSNQRLLLNIRNIRLGTSILPVDLTVYDLDGMEGIRAPDLVTQEAMRSGSDNALASLQLMTMDQSLATQAAGAGVEAAKGLFSKKIRRVKVRLKAGYPVLLRNNRPDKK